MLQEAKLGINLLSWRGIDHCGWRISVCEGLSDKIVHEIIGSLDQLKPTRRTYRHRGLIRLSHAGEHASLFVKSNMICYAGLNPFMLRRALSALRACSLLNEARSYLEYSRRGILTPVLCFFGEYKVLGIRVKEIIAIDRIESDTIKEIYQASGDETNIFQVAGFLAHLHNQGLAHGDCMLHNFMLLPAGVCAVDLESSKQLTEQTQLNDLIGFGSSFLRMTGNIVLLETALNHYASRSTHNLAFDLPTVVDSSIALVRRKPFDSVYIPTDQV